MFNVGKSSNLKKLIVFMVCLFVGLTVSSIFALNKTNVETNPALEVSSNLFETNKEDGQIVDGDLSLNWNPNKKNVRPMSATNNVPSTGDKNYYWVLGEGFTTNTTFQAGTTITVSGTTIIFTDPAGNRLSATVYAKQHYVINGIHLGYKDGTSKNFLYKYSVGESKLYYLGDTNQTAISSLTTEQLDPSYSGNLLFEIFEDDITPIPYAIDFFYQTSESASWSNVRVNYNIENGIDIDAIQPISGQIVTWWFREERILNGTTVGTVGQNTLTCTTTTGASLSFGRYTSEGGTLTNPTLGKSHYRITQLNVGSYGNYIDGNGQDATNPVIIAKFEDGGDYDGYTIKIDNRDTYWTEPVENTEHDFTYNFGLTAEETKTLTGAGIVGADSSIVFDNSHYQTTILTNVNKNNTAKFYYVEDLSLTKIPEACTFDNSVRNANSLFFVHNYGHYVDTYKIEVDFKSTGDGVDCEYNPKAQGWNTIGDFLTGIDTLMEFESDYPEITIYPIWEETTINVLCDDENVGTLIYANNTNLNVPIEDPAGKTFFCYVQNKNLIAYSGIWNYINLNYVHNEESTYDIEVSAYYLNDACKMTLDVIVSNGVYSLEKTDYAYGTGYSADFYDYKTLKGSVAIYDKNAYPLVENYVNTELVGFINDYSEKLAGADYSIFKKVYYSTGTVSGNTLTVTEVPSLYIYLATGQSVKNSYDEELKEYAGLPMFAYLRSKIIGWIENTDYYTTNGYQDLFSAEFEGLEYKLIWEYNNSRVLTPRYVYALDLYYENGEVDYKNTVSANDDVYKYSSKIVQWYGAATILDYSEIEVLEEEIPSFRDSFTCWMLDIPHAIANNFTNIVRDVVIDGETATGTVTISDGINSFAFTVNGVNKWHTDANGDYLYYNVTAIQGASLVNQSKVDDKGQQLPVVRAKWGNLYDLTINNTSSYWNDVANGAKSNDSSLFGAVSSDETEGKTVDDNDFRITTLKVKNYQGDAYPFQNTSSKAFYKDSELSKSNVNSVVSDKFYYVYSYGQYIKDWEITCSGITFYFDGSSWSLKQSSVPLSYLSDVTFDEVASQMDDYFVMEPGEFKILLKPGWGDANIGVVSSQGGNIGEAKFGENYTLTSGTAISLGQSLFAYQVKDSGQMIAYVPGMKGDSGIWNYMNINKDYYSYNSSSEKNENDGSGVYTINVNPIFVDDIYKINLTNIKYASISENVKTYQLGPDIVSGKNEQWNYAFDNQVGKDENVYSLNKYDFKTSKINDYQFAAYSDQTLIDNYIISLDGYGGNWLLGIAGGFDIFKNVYYSDGVVSTSKNVNDTLKTSGNPTFHMYLANGQEFGSVPVFEKEFFDHIFWININMPKEGDVLANPNLQRIYKTSKFEDNHSQELLENGSLKYVYKENVWELADGYYANRSDQEVTFDAYYYRKYYNVEITTKLNEEIMRTGYVHVCIEDNLHEMDDSIENMGGNFIVIAEESTVNGVAKTIMKIYKENNYSTSLTECVMNDGTLYTIDDGSVISAITGNYILRLYEGCSITLNVKDQSKDKQAMATGNYDSMIGYRFDGELIDDNQLFGEPQEVDLYKYSVGYRDIANKNYEDYLLIPIVVNYTHISYTLRFRLNGYNSGSLTIENNGNIMRGQTDITLTTIKVGSKYSVEYFANAGYTLNEMAFLLSNGVQNRVLQEYVEVGENINLSQHYSLTSDQNIEYLDGTWLRENFYSDYGKSDACWYSVDPTILGVLYVSTEEIEFNYGVKVYDSSQMAFVETLEEVDTVILNSGKYTTQQVGHYLTNENYGFWYYKVTDGTPYALLSSRMYFPDLSSALEEAGNDVETYDFLLSSKPTKQTILTTTLLSQMVINYQEGKIIPVENRNIYILLEVRKLYEIDMSVQQLENDTNNTTRIATLSNGTKVGEYNKENNKQSIEILGAANVNADKFYLKSDNANINVVNIYTYHGLVNKFEFVYDSNRYSAVEYYIDNSVSAGEDNEFEVTKNSSVVIKYVPVELLTEYVYKLDGLVVSSGELSEYIVEDKTAMAEKYTLNKKVIYSIEVTNDDYMAEISINNRYLISTTNNQSSITTDYNVVNADYDNGKIQIVVNVKPKDSTKILINYELKDSSEKALGDDDYGTFSIYIGNVLKMEDVSSAEVGVIDGRSVYVKLNVPIGYRYYGIRHGASSVQEVAQNADGRILMIENFSSANNIVNYFIVLEKLNVRAELDKSALVNTTFEAYIDGKDNLTGLFVGKEITCSYKEINGERLDCFYYTKSSGEEVEIDPDQNGNISLKITSALLDEVTADEIQATATSFNIKLGIKTVLRYKLEITIDGEENLQENGLTVKFASGDDYSLGTYQDVGTELYITITPETVGKYNVAFNGKTGDQFVSEEIILAGNINANIKISPKQYSVEIEENVYSDIKQVQDGTPTSVEVSSQVNDLNATGQQYNNNAVIEFKRVAVKADGSLDRELTAVHLYDAERDITIDITFNGTAFNASVDGNSVNLLDYEYLIEITNVDTIKLTYVTKNDISLRIDYTDYKVINAG